MKRPLEQDYTSLTAYTRALEEYCDALARVAKGMHGSILPGCMCPWTPLETDCYGDGNVYRGVRSRDSELNTFKPG
jgi:hypothetical protein